MDLAELARDDVADDAAEMVTKRSSADRGFDPLVAYLEGLDLKSSETIEAESDDGLDDWGQPNA